MSETPENHITAALTFKVPQKVGWSVQRGAQSWSGKNLAGLSDCMAQVGKSDPVTLSISLIFELTGTKERNGRRWRHPRGMIDDEEVTSCLRSSANALLRCMNPWKTGRFAI